MIEADLRSLAEHRSRVYWLLGRLFLERPEAEFLDRLRLWLGGAGDTPAGAAGALREAAQACADAAALERLGVDYTRLLRAIGEVPDLKPPFESLHRGPRASAEAAVAVARHMAEAGFGEVAPEAGPQDHIGAELTYMSLLCFRESEAYGRETAEPPERWRARQRGFLDAHLLAWAPAFCRSLAAAAREDFYRAAARLASETLEADRVLLAEIEAAA